MYKRDGLASGFWDSMQKATLKSMPKELQEAYLRTAPHPDQLPVFHDKCKQRMLEFQDWKAEDIHAITAPTLVMIGDHDIIRPEHAVEMFRLLPQGQLAVLPGTDHMSIVKQGDRLAGLVEAFLDAPRPKEKKQ